MIQKRHKKSMLDRLRSFKRATSVETLFWLGMGLMFLVCMEIAVFLDLPTLDAVGITVITVSLILLITIFWKSYGQKILKFTDDTIDYASELAVSALVFAFKVLGSILLACASLIALYIFVKFIKWAWEN